MLKINDLLVFWTCLFECALHFRHLISGYVALITQVLIHLTIVPESNTMNTMFIDYIDNYFIIQFVMLEFVCTPHNTIKMYLYNYFRIHICMNDYLFQYDANMSFLANKCIYNGFHLQMYLRHIISYPDYTSFMLFSIITCMHISYNTLSIRIFYVTIIIICSSFSWSSSSIISKQICSAK